MSKMRLYDVIHRTKRASTNTLRTILLSLMLTLGLVLSGCSLIPSQLEKIAGIARTPNAGSLSATATSAPPSISTAALVKGRSKLRVGIRFDAPPLASVTSDGKLEGMDVDITREFARRWLGSADNVEFIQVTSASAPRMIEQREIDFALGGLIHTKAAATRTDFGLTYLYDGEALMVRTGSYADFQSLARRNVTYIDLSSTFAMRDAQIANNLTVTLQSAPSYDAAIRQVRDGQTDAVLGRWRRLRTVSGRDPALSILTIFEREPVAFLLPRNDSDWASLVNFTFSALILDGTFSKMYKKWFNQLPEPVYPLPNAIDIQLAGLPDVVTPHNTLKRVRSNTSVRIGFIAQADPLATLDSKGQAVGFEVDICRELVRRWFQNTAGAEFTAVPAGDIAGLLRNNSIDMAIGGIPETQANARVMDFSSITYQSGVGIAVLGTSTANDMASLNGKTVGTIQDKSDAAVLTAFAKARNLTITSRTYPDLITMFDALRNGQVDGALGDQTTLIALARTAKDIRVLSERLNNLPIGIAMARDDSTFKTFVNLSLQEMFTDGTYAFLYKKWFGTTAPGMEIWPGEATMQTVLVAPTATPLPTVTPVFSAIDTPAPGQIQPTPSPTPLPTPTPAPKQ